MTLSDLNEIKRIPSEMLAIRSVLEKHDRAKILEIYFSRLDGREPSEADEEVKDLYDMDLEQIKSFLLGQHPQDPLLQKLFRIMN